VWRKGEAHNGFHLSFPKRFVTCPSVQAVDSRARCVAAPCCSRRDCDLPDTYFHHRVKTFTSFRQSSELLCWLRFPTLKRGANERCAYGAGLFCAGWRSGWVEVWSPTLAVKTKTPRGWGTRRDVGLKVWSPTLAAKTKTRRGWGTRRDVGLKVWYLTLAAKTRTRRGWGTRLRFGAEKRQRQEQPQILRLTTPKLKNAWGPVRSG
jgi:hypothetical protein